MFWFWKVNIDLFWLEFVKSEHIPGNSLSHVNFATKNSVEKKIVQLISEIFIDNKLNLLFLFKENNFSKLAFYLYSLQTSTEPIKFGPGDYRCPYCDKKSEKKQHMQYHIRVHTGEQPFKCPYCPKKFTHKHNRSQHIRNIHTHDPYQIQNWASFVVV